MGIATVTATMSACDGDGIGDDEMMRKNGGDGETAMQSPDVNATSSHTDLWHSLCL